MLLTAEEAKRVKPLRSNFRRYKGKEYMLRIGFLSYAQALQMEKNHPDWLIYPWVYPVIGLYWQAHEPFQGQIRRRPR